MLESNKNLLKAAQIAGIRKYYSKISKNLYCKPRARTADEGARAFCLNIEYFRPILSIYCVFFRRQEGCGANRSKSTQNNGKTGRKSSVSAKKCAFKRLTNWRAEYIIVERVKECVWVEA